MHLTNFKGQDLMLIYYFGNEISYSYSIHINVLIFEFVWQYRIKIFEGAYMTRHLSTMIFCTFTDACIIGVNKIYYYSY